MIIYNTVYEAIKQHLNAVQSIKEIDWYNQQYQNFNSEKAIPRRAVYVEMLDPVNWDQMTPGQSGSVNITLHCVVYDVKDSPVKALEFAQEVWKALQRKDLFDEDNQQVTTELIRSSTNMPKRYDQVKVMQVTFVTHVYDGSGIEDTQDVNVNFNVNVD